MKEENFQQSSSEFEDNFEKYLEYLSRIMPTTLPEWMD